MIIKAIIIEDELPARKTLKSYINNYFPQIEVVGEARDVENAIILINSEIYDLIFLDVHLKDGSGVDILRDCDVSKMRVIFTTAYEDYTVEAFKLKAFGYLMKPLDPIDFKEIVSRTIKDVYINYTENVKLKIPLSNGFAFLNSVDILRCEAESNYTKIFTTEGKTYLVSKSLKHFELELGEAFLRVHQSHLINIQFIDSNHVGTNEIFLKNRDCIPVSRSRKEGLIKALSKLP